MIHSEKMTEVAKLQRRLIWAVLVCYWLAIFVATHLPSAEKTGTSGGNDKIKHVLAYSGLAFLLTLILPVVAKRRRAVVVFATVVGYGMCDELTQILVPTRMADWRDLAADTVGAGIGIVIALVLAPFWSWIIEFKQAADE